MGTGEAAGFIEEGPWLPLVSSGELSAVQKGLYLSYESYKKETRPPSRFLKYPQPYPIDFPSSGDVIQRNVRPLIN